MAKFSLVKRFVYRLKLSAAQETAGSVTVLTDYQLTFPLSENCNLSG